MSRLPPIPPSAQTPQQATTHSAMEKLITSVSTSFIRKDAHGALLGPFAAMLYAPTPIATDFNQTVSTLIADTTLTPRERELAILAVCAVYSAKYLTYVHSIVGVQVGLEEGQVAAAREGTVPDGLAAQERGVFVWALLVASARGAVEDGAWEAAQRVLGREKALVVGCVVGAWTYSSMIMNLADVPVPVPALEGEKV